MFLYSKITIHSDPTVHLGSVDAAFLGLFPPWLSVTLAIESCNRCWPPKSVILSGQSGSVMSCLEYGPAPSPHMGPTLPGLGSSIHSAWPIVGAQ